MRIQIFAILPLCYLGAIFFPAQEARGDWDPKELGLHGKFVRHRDSGEFEKGAIVASEWLAYAKATDDFPDSLYSLTREAEATDFHEEILYLAWNTLAKSEDGDPAAVIAAIKRWLVYLEETHGPSDPISVRAPLSLAWYLESNHRFDDALEVLEEAEIVAEEELDNSEENQLVGIYESLLAEIGNGIKRVKIKRIGAVRGAARGAGDQDANYAEIPVFFGTDRKPTGLSDFNTWYSGGPAGEISYGMCKVSIPFSHQKGKVERPKWWKFEMEENPSKHVVILDLKPFDRAVFLEKVQGDLRDAARSARKEGEAERKKMFVFVHGFNVTFAGAARRTAQLQFDLGFTGTPIFYSWPSKGSIPGYMTDEITIQHSRKHLGAFLLDLAEETDSDEIFLIAHSMGARALLKCFPSVYKKAGTRREVFREIIVAAPDIDKGIFDEEIAPALFETGVPITVYASKGDRALMASRQARGGYARLGESAAELAGISHLEPIDASLVRTDFLSHSFYSTDRSMIFDLYQLIANAKRAPERKSTLLSIPVGKDSRFFRVKP